MPIDPSKIQELAAKGLISQETAQKAMPSPMLLEQEQKSDEKQGYEQAREEIAQAEQTDATDSQLVATSLSSIKEDAKKVISPARQYLTDVTIGEHEGGYQADETDRGNYYKGELIGTNFGISAPVLAMNLGRTPTVDDMKNLTKEEALDIYEKQYVDKPGFDELSDKLSKAMIDFGINSGPGTAIRHLQKVIGTSVDGRLGGTDIEAIGKKKEKEIVNALVDRRVNMIKNSGKIHKRWKKGLIKRAESFKIK